MATYRGFVSALEVRGDGWAEFVLQAVHAGNGTQTFYITNLDGDILTANRRLAHLSMLRDAVARVLPVEVEYDPSNEQGNVVEDLIIYPRPSFEGREPGRRIEGVVIGLIMFERGPESGTSPYIDEADLGGVTLLVDDGSVEQVLLDLQRPDVMTAHAMLALLRKAHRTRRPVALLVDSGFQDDRKPGSAMKQARSADSDRDFGSYIQACEWITVPEESLQYEYAFIERLGQRYESYDATEAPALSHVKVIYTTAPAQTPEGDVSDNGSFVPQTLEARVHGDSPLLSRLEAALRDRLQVKIGTLDSKIHEVEMVGHLGSAARPIWIKVNRVVIPPKDDTGMCENVPTIQTPTEGDFNEVPHAISWQGDGYFNEGIWRFTISSGGDCRLLIDGEKPCCCTPAIGIPSLEGDYSEAYLSAKLDIQRSGRGVQCHAYLNGMHNVELILSGHTCSKPFQLKAYRIR
jgi:hypothetical protein